jgi:hypothetical protein
MVAEMTESFVPVVWLWVEDPTDVNTSLNPVCTRDEATVMDRAVAQHISQYASKAFIDCEWRVIPVDRDLCIVGGREKVMSQADAWLYVQNPRAGPEERNLENGG